MGGYELPPDLDVRKSLCFTQLTDHVIIHDSDNRFDEELGRLYKKEETRLLEGLLHLKDTLKKSDNDDFWAIVTEGMAELLGAQMSFVSKRILVDEHDSAIEMPPLGEPGACLMASAFHYVDGKGEKNTLKAFKYHAYGCPCGYMRHDKVFIVPEGMNQYFNENPNQLPFKDEAYIGVPLFAEGKCFAHFGIIWSADGAAKREYSWTQIELFMHSLEDMILQRLLDGSRFVKSDPTPAEKSRVIPHEAVTAAQSLKPYARSLSHELRTPMQGVVGMLDVMYATVQEAAEGHTDPEIRRVFEQLKENIETVQGLLSKLTISQGQSDSFTDSSRRAVEAADNVVHAYDMDMSVPEGPTAIHMEESSEGFASAPTDKRPEILVAGSDLPISRPNKRRREEIKESDSPSKVQATLTAWASRSQPSDRLMQGLHEAEVTSMPGRILPERRRSSIASFGSATTPAARDFATTPLAPERTIAPGFRHTHLRHVLQYVVNEGLKVGGRPESAIARETDLGEVIEVWTRSSNGEPRTKTIEWSVDSTVPETIFGRFRQFVLSAATMLTPSSR